MECPVETRLRFEKSLRFDSAIAAIQQIGEKLFPSTEDFLLVCDEVVTFIITDR